MPLAKASRTVSSPVSALRRAGKDFDGLHHILGDYLKDMSQTQRAMRVGEFFDGWKGPNIAARLGVLVNTRAPHRHAAFRTRRDAMTTVADLSTEIDLPGCYWSDRNDEQVPSASQRRRASCEEGNRSNFEGDGSNFEGDGSNFEGDGSNFEGDGSNFEGDAEKNERARDISVVLPTKS
jgi:hypothetical protein